MFALAVWDRRERLLHLIRDRLGKKPLYYGTIGSVLLFGSELKALRAWPGVDYAIDREALTSFMRLGYVPAPYTIYRGVHKLPAASVVTFRPSAVAGAGPVQFWSLHDAAVAGLRDPDRRDPAAVLGDLDALLRDAVARRTIADVPLGAFLSGGVDSSLVTALMQAQQTSPVKTFSIGFDEPAYDEAAHAKAVARHLGTDHTELYVTSAEARDVIPELPGVYDEPFADASAIPTILVSRLARRAVTVSLSGDGGDELFAGYGRYRTALAVWRTLQRAPRQVRAGAATALAAVSRLERGVRRTATPQPRGGWGDRLDKLAAMMPAPGPQDLYLQTISHWLRPEAIVAGGREAALPLTTGSLGQDLADPVARMLYCDTSVYLPENILVKVDRASMSVSLEVRAPLLDYRVVEFAWRVPMSMKTRDGQGKWPLRELLYRYVPRPLVDRPKAGFDVPIGTWLRGPLRAWAEAFLDERRLRESGLWHPAPIRRKWREHLSGVRNWQYPLWNVLSVEAWRQSRP
jgi:asparagine synthase (glutamine-hydrolysing)